MRASSHFLGVHIGHDRGAALVSDGRLVACVAEERLDRRKHSNSPDLPMLSIRALLRSRGLSPLELEGAAISYTNVSIDRVIGQLRDELRDLLDVPHLPVLGAEHHLCHALSAYFTSGVDDAIVVVADGAGDIVGSQIEAESYFEAEGTDVTLLTRRLQDFGLTRTDRRNAFNPDYLHEVDRNKEISLGRKYEQFTYLIGFGHSQAGKTMGLAAYGEPLFRIPIQDGGTQFSLRFADGIDELHALWAQSDEPWHRFVRNRAARIAATAQALLEDFIVEALRGVHETSPRTTLCAAGGVFLNCKLNHEILKRTPFRHLHVFPAAGDDGQAVGAAFYAYNQLAGPRLPSPLPNVFLGPSYQPEEIEERLAHFELAAERLSDHDLAERLAEELSDGRFYGVLRGRSEIGPRALGHRSILADPRRCDARERLNRLKGREQFRPFAPMVCAEEQFRYFVLEQESRFMLLATEIQAAYRSSLPAVVHADGTSRVQAVEREEDPFMHSVLRQFEHRSGFPILLNTSFNIAGDPIVESPHDAIATFLASGLDGLVLENYLVSAQPSSRTQLRRAA